MPTHIEVSCRPPCLFLAHGGSISPISALDGAPFPLGAALAFDLRQISLNVLADAFRAHGRSPWCPMAVALPDGASETTLESILPDWGCLATLPIRSEEIRPTYCEVAAAIERRGPPGCHAVIRYIRSRAGEHLAREVAKSLEGSGAWSAGLWPARYAEPAALGESVPTRHPPRLINTSAGQDAGTARAGVELCPSHPQRLVCEIPPEVLARGAPPSWVGVDLRGGAPATRLMCMSCSGGHAAELGPPPPLRPSLAARPQERTIAGRGCASERPTTRRT